MCAPPLLSAACFYCLSLPLSRSRPLFGTTGEGERVIFKISLVVLHLAISLRFFFLNNAPPSRRQFSALERWILLSFCTRCSRKNPTLMRARVYVCMRVLLSYMGDRCMCVCVYCSATWVTKAGSPRIHKHLGLATDCVVASSSLLLPSPSVYLTSPFSLVARAHTHSHAHAYAHSKTKFCFIFPG